MLGPSFAYTPRGMVRGGGGGGSQASSTFPLRTKCKKGERGSR